MYEPILFYGINLGRIPEQRMNLPEEVMSEDSMLGEIDAVAFEELAKKHGLEAFFGEDGCYFEKTCEFNQVHVGFEIKYKYGEYGECISFNLKHLDSLRENPSELLEKLKKIGLNIRNDQLRLYGYTAID